MVIERDKGVSKDRVEDRLANVHDELVVDQKAAPRRDVKPVVPGSYEGVGAAYVNPSEVPPQGGYKNILDDYN